MRPLNDWGPGVYDYATSPNISPELDLALASDCDLFVGTASGAILMPIVFRRPNVYIGGALPFCFCASGLSNELGIPKLIRDKQTGKLLDFETLYESRTSEIRLAYDVDALGLEVVDNSELEVLEVVEEMLGRLSGTWIDTTGDLQLQSRFQSLIKHGSHTHVTASRCGTLFLRRYEQLLGIEAKGSH